MEKPPVKKFLHIRKVTNRNMCLFTSEQLSAKNWKSLKTIDLTRELLRNGINVVGDKMNLANLIRTKILNLEPIVSQDHQLDIARAAHIVRRFIIKSAVCLSGFTKNRKLCENEEDLDTTQEITNISDTYLFCLHEADSWYGFDIRTLSIIINGPTAINPYTQNKLSVQSVNDIQRKIKILRSLKFPLERNDFASHSMSEHDKFMLYVTDVFKKLHHLDYSVDRERLLELSAKELQKLYIEVNDIWIHRIGDISMEDRKRIVRNGVIFAEIHEIKQLKCTEADKDLLLRKILKNLNRLITEGLTVDDRKLGAIYFMIGLTIVSKKVAEAYPILTESHMTV